MHVSAHSSARCQFPLAITVFAAAYLSVVAVLVAPAVSLVLHTTAASGPASLAHTQTRP